MLDLVIEHGQVADGTGAPLRRADVGVLGDRIVEVGPLADAPAIVRIDACDLLVAPGFVDIHTHSDYTLLANRSADSFIHQGITTEVIGNCGYSPAPIADPELLPRLVIAHVPSVEVNWRGFGEYLATLGRGGLGINVASLAGHGAIRAHVLGFDSRPATSREIESMKTLLTEALREGAFGLSTGLEYAPGASALPEEIEALCRVVAENGGLYASHVRDRDEGFLKGFGEALNAAAASGARLQVSHVTPKFGAPAGAARQALGLFRRWRESGVDVATDVMMYSWCPTMLAAILPAWAFEGGTASTLARLRDPHARREMKEHGKPIWKLVTAGRWDRIQLFRSGARPDLVGKSFAEIGKLLGVSPHDAALDLLLAEGEGMFDVWMLGKILEDEDIFTMLEDLSCAICSDGMSISPTGVTSGLGWGPRCYGWTALALRVLVRERQLFSLAETIRRMTSLPASRVGLTDRGRVAAGCFADLVVLNPETIADRGTYDGPAHYPDGIEHVVVNGELVLEHGQATGGSPGRVLRKGR